MDLPKAPISNLCLPRASADLGTLSGADLGTLLGADLGTLLGAEIGTLQQKCRCTIRSVGIKKVARRYCQRKRPPVCTAKLFRLPPLLPNLICQYCQGRRGSGMLGMPYNLVFGQVRLFGSS